MSCGYSANFFLCFSIYALHPDLGHGGPVNRTLWGDIWWHEIIYIRKFSCASCATRPLWLSTFNSCFKPTIFMFTAQLWSVVWSEVWTSKSLQLFCNWSCRTSQTGTRLLAGLGSSPHFNAWESHEKADKTAKPNKSKIGLKIVPKPNLSMAWDELF